MQFGGGRMGGVALAAGVDVPQDFRNCPEGPIDSMFLTIAVSGKASGAGSFALVVATEGSATSEGSDDLDDMMDALFTSLTMYLDPAHMMFSLTPSRLRTILGLFNQRDIAGTFLNAATVNGSGGANATYNIVIRIPISLASYFEDGTIFQNGSHRVKTGSMIYRAAALTPTVVLSNGSFVVSGFSVSIRAQTGAGSASDVGMSWSIKRLSGLPTDYAMSPGMRLGVLDTQTVTANTVTAYNFDGFDLFTPSDFGSRYQTDRLQDGGYDITARATPLLFIERSRKFMDFLAHVGKEYTVSAVSGVSSQSFYDVQAHPVPPAIVEDVSVKVGGGGPVSLANPTPPSLPPGARIPPALSGLLPVRVLQGRVSDGGTGAVQKKSNPADAAAGALQKEVTAQRYGAAFKLFGRGRR